MEFFCGSGPECQTATNQADEEAYKTRMLEKVAFTRTLPSNSFKLGKTTSSKRLLRHWRPGAVRGFAARV